MRICIAAGVAAGLLCLASTIALAQEAEPQVSPESVPAQDSTTLPEVVVEASEEEQAASNKKKKNAASTQASTQSADAAPQTPPPGNDRQSSESAWGPVDGYVATFSASGTKTDTPLIEIPQSISIVTADQMEAQQVTSFTEVFRYVPGVSAEPFGFESRFTWVDIRGFDATREGLYLDGLQLRNPDYVTSYSPEPYGAERIEIPKGPASVLYGAGSPGGIVDYITKRPVDETFSEIELEVGSNELYQGKFDFGGRVDEMGTLLFRMTGVVRDAETQQDFVQDDRIYLAPSFTLRPDSSTIWTVLAHYQDDDTNVSQAVPAIGQTSNIYPGIEPSFFPGEPDVDFYEREEYAVTSLFEHAFDEAWTVRQNARYLHSKLDLASVYSSGLQADGRTLDRAYYARDTELDAFNVDNQVIAKFGTGTVRHTLLFGLDYQYLDARDIGAYGSVGTIDIYAPVYDPASVAVAGLYSDKDIEQSQTGIYVQDQIKLTRNWIISLGGRYDWAKNTVYNYLSSTESNRNDEAFSGRAGLVYKSDFGLAPYVSYSESFLPVSETDTAGNILDPETGQQYEIGVKYQPPGMKSFVTVALFDLTRQNFVEYNDATFFYEQTGEANSQGIELSATASLTEGLDLVASFTTFDIEITESRNAAEIGKDPLQTPETLASLWADYTFQYGSLEGFGFGGGVRYIGSSYADAANTIKVSDVTLFDAAIHYEFDDIRLALNVKNLFDKEYAAGCFVRSSTLCTYGATRDVIGSLKVRW
jgi:iron complex outermembrane recepter protein